MPETHNETAILNISPEEQVHQLARKLAHDLRSPLSVISMGIEAIRIMKHDPIQCDALCDMMAKEGIDAMKRILEEMVERTASATDS
ncbi:MAG: hypothetical protein ACTHOU_02930 [Aureliella sp.]|jgi:signal transduction histidine kinase